MPEGERGGGGGYETYVASTNAKNDEASSMPKPAGDYAKSSADIQVHGLVKGDQAQVQNESEEFLTEPARVSTYSLPGDGIEEGGEWEVGTKAGKDESNQCLTASTATPFRNDHDEQVIQTHAF